MKWLSASQEIEMKEEETKSIQDVGSIHDSWAERPVHFKYNTVSGAFYHQIQKFVTSGDFLSPSY